MSDFNKKVNIDFTDNGTLNRLKQIYGQLFQNPSMGMGGNGMMGGFGAGINPLFQRLGQLQGNYFGQNGSITQNNQAFKSSIDNATRNFQSIADAFKKFDNDVSSYNKARQSLQRQEDALRTSGYNPDGAIYQKEKERLDRERQRVEGIKNSISDPESLLKGTGYRKRETFERGFEKTTRASEKEYQKRTNLAEKANQILSQILLQDSKTAKESVKAIEKNSKATEEQKLAAKIYREAEEPERIQKRQQLLATLGTVGLGALATGVQMNSRYLNYNRQLTMSTNGFDALQAHGDFKGDMWKMGMQGAGGIAGTVTAGLVGGTMLGGPVGAIAGGAAGLLVGGLFGDWIENSIKKENDQTVRALRYREDFLKVGNKQSALSGVFKNAGDPSELNPMGYSSLDFMNASLGIMKAQGSSSNVKEITTKSLAYEKGWGIDQSLTTELITQLRSSRSTDRDIQNIIGGVFEKGKDIFKGDRTYLGEFLQTKFLPLQRELLRNQTSVSSGTTMDILSKFNSMGGQFDSKHQNSSSLLSQINGALINPGSDAANAISFQALRNSDPSMGLFGTLKERQKGLGSKKYLSSVMSMIDQMGGSEDIKKLNMAGMLGLDNNLDAVDTLYQNRNRIDSMSQSELKSLTSPKEEAKLNTTEEERFGATIYNVILTNYTKALDTVQARFTSIMAQVTAGELAITIKSDGSFTQERLPVANKTKEPSAIMTSKRYSDGMFFK